jgi:hypothetical protein
MWRGGARCGCCAAPYTAPARPASRVTSRLTWQGELTAKYGVVHTGDAGGAEKQGPAAAAPAAAAVQEPPERQHAEASANGGGEHGGEPGQARPKRAASARAPRVATKAVAAAGAVSREQQRARDAKQLLQELIKATRRLFALLPLGAVVGRHTLVLHGGLFRAPPAAGHKGKKRAAKPGASARAGCSAVSGTSCLQPGGSRGRTVRPCPPPAAHPLRSPPPPTPLAGPLQVGSLADLRAASKGGQDPNGEGGRGWDGGCPAPSSTGHSQSAER